MNLLSKSRWKWFSPPPRTRVGELRLVMDGNKPPRYGRFGFADIFFAPGGADASVLLELKYLPLPGLLSGRSRCWISKPNDEELEKFSEEISAMTESKLDELRFAYYSQNEGRYVFTTVGKIRQDALKQVQGYSKVLEKGVALGEHGSGVNDVRVKVEPGTDTLRSFTLVAVGGKKILWQSAGEVKTKFSYRCTAI